MKIILDYWNRRWQSVAFDPTVGRASIRWLARRPKQCAGWAAHHDGRWYAVRLDSNVLVFQVGPDKWSMEGDFRCKNTRHGAARLFSVHRAAEIVFQCRYASEPELDDPTADRLDLETTDFFYWVAQVWNDPGLRVSLKSAWSTAAHAA
jgi:hypothetical protein